MDKGTVQEIGKQLQPLADKIGKGAGHLYEVYIRQQYVTGIADLIGGLILLLVSMAVFTVSFKLWRNNSDEFFVVMWLIIGAGLFGCFAGLTTNGVMHLLSPEYYALQDILCTVRNCNAR